VGSGTKAQIMRRKCQKRIALIRTIPVTFILPHLYGRGVIIYFYILFNLCINFFIRPVNDDPGTEDN
jgi:hypothetical protein